MHLQIAWLYLTRLNVSRENYPLHFMFSDNKFSYLIHINFICGDLNENSENDTFNNKSS